MSSQEDNVLVTIHCTNPYSVWVSAWPAQGVAGATTSYMAMRMLSRWYGSVVARSLEI
jgi:hypothetical protein